MCEFCLKHGEGEKWYLQAKNYVEEFLTDELKQFLTDHWETLEETLVPSLAAGDQLDVSDPAIKGVLATRVEQTKKQQWGQVIPIEDAEKILDMTVSIARIPCLCRSALHGVYDRRFCYVFAAFESDFWPKGMFQQFPDLSKELEVLTKEEAKDELRKLDHEALVHTIWAYGVPWAANICNCGPKDCIAFRAGERMTRAYFKAEYVAAMDIEKCTGCRDCMSFCNFGAIQYSPAAGKCTINQFKCAGCGLCRQACSFDAITLFDRNAIPVLANDW